MFQDSPNFLSFQTYPAAFPLPFGLCLLIRHLISSSSLACSGKTKMFVGYYSQIRFILEGASPKPCYHFNGEFLKIFYYGKVEKQTKVERLLYWQTDLVPIIQLPQLSTWSVLLHLYLHPFSTPNTMNNFEANLRHHSISSINTSVYISKN